MVMMRLLIKLGWSAITAASPLLLGCQAVPPPAAAAPQQAARRPNDVPDSKVHLTSLTETEGDAALNDLGNPAEPDTSEIVTPFSVSAGALAELEAWAISNNPTLRRMRH